MQLKKNQQLNLHVYVFYFQYAYIMQVSTSLNHIGEEYPRLPGA